MVAFTSASMNRRAVSNYRDKVDRCNNIAVVFFCANRRLIFIDDESAWLWTKWQLKVESDEWEDDLVTRANRTLVNIYTNFFDRETKFTTLYECCRLWEELQLFFDVETGATR